MSKPDRVANSATILIQDWLDVGNRNLFVEGFLKLCESSVFDRGGVLTCGNQLGTDVENRVAMLVKGVDDVLSEGKLVRVADDGPVLKEVPRRGKDKNQDQSAKNVVLKRASRVTPENDFVYSRHSFQAESIDADLDVDRILFAIKADIVFVRNDTPVTHFN